MRVLLVAVAALAITFSCCAIALCEADAVVVGNQIGPIEANTWTYMVSNTSDTDCTLWMIGIAVDPATTVVSASAPDGSGWTVDYKSDPQFVMWLYDYELPKGVSQQDFTVAYSAMPAYQAWSAQFFDPNGDIAGADGTVMVSPEPGSIVALLTGLVSLGAIVSRRKK